MPLGLRAQGLFYARRDGLVLRTSPTRRPCKGCYGHYYAGGRERDAQRGVRGEHRFCNQSVATSQWQQSATSQLQPTGFMKLFSCNQPVSGLARHLRVAS